MLKYNILGTVFVFSRRNSSILFFIYILLFYNLLKTVINKWDGCEYLKKVLSIDGSLELI
jgi:hypothetical protein